MKWLVVMEMLHTLQSAMSKYEQLGSPEGSWTWEEDGMNFQERNIAISLSIILSIGKCT